MKGRTGISRIPVNIPISESFFNASNRFELTATLGSIFLAVSSSAAVTVIFIHIGENIEIFPKIS